MAGSGAGKGQTAKPTNALLLLALHAALLHTAAAGKNFRCPQGTLYKPIPIRWNEHIWQENLWPQPLCNSQNNEGTTCCKLYSSNNSYDCAHGNACDGPATSVCTPGEDREDACCAEPDGSGFGRPPYGSPCKGILTAIVCPERKVGSAVWNPQKTHTRSKFHMSCCKYNPEGDREYTIGYSENYWDGTNSWEKSTSRDPEHCKAGDCVPEDGKRCCAKPDGSGGFVKLPECPKVHWPQCPKGKAGRAWSPSNFIDCPTGCCVYDGRKKMFSCGKSTKGQCQNENQYHCNEKKAGLHCFPKDEGGFVAKSKTSCFNKFKDGYLEVEGDCPDVGCPTEVARQPSREDSTKARGNSAWKRGDCCVKDGHETSKWARGSQCKTPVGKEGDACIPKANQKCCFHTEGKKLTAVEFTADCESPTKPKCPKGDGRGKPASCESGCCVYFYATNKFGCAPKGPDGQCPPAKEKEQTCTAGRGKNDACCAAVENGKIVGGFDSENAGKCASPMIKCGKAAGAEPEPCADGTFKCCVGNQCSKDCSAPEGCGKGDKCTPGNTVEYFRKCCVNEYGDGYVKLPNGEACPEKRAPFGCPLEVAEEPETKTCGRVRGQCCVLEGPGKANCASGDRCEDEGEICQPESDHKCCLSPNGKALLFRKTADPCPAKPKDEGGFVAKSKTSCFNKFKDGYLEVEGDCPDVGCPTEVARQPSREDSTKARGNSAWKRGDCCVKDGHETSKWARGSQCKTPVGKEGDACIPKANQKCCFHTEGKKLTAVEFTADCESPTKPKCPKGDGRGKPASCESGCCVYFYATNKFGCAPKGPDGQCPPAKEKEQTCTAGRGKNDACCAAVENGKIVGGFDSENAGKCASPNIKCGKAAGAEPEPCADGTFKCCVGNQCSKDCSATEGRGKGDKCTPGNTVEYFRKCCVNEYGDGYVKLPNGEACPEKRAPFGCPLEVAEEPETKTCGRVRGQCCVLEGPGKANCASGDRCEDEGEICQPESDHKCCLSPNGKALLIRKTADPCPAKPPQVQGSEGSDRMDQCKDRKAAKIAECEEKDTGKEACKKVVEKCLVDEGVSKAGAGGGKDCEEAWAECERSQTGAAEAHGPKRAPFGCPLEVAEEPETKTCGRVRGQCCVLEGPGKANCASGDRCEDEGEICQPESDHKCCLSPNGKALLIRKTADPCPAKPPQVQGSEGSDRMDQCKDRKAAKIAECEEKDTGKEACKKVVEKCLVDEGVSKAGAGGGKDCEEAWAECERSQTGAAEAHGPSLRLLAPATLLLLLPH